MRATRLLRPDYAERFRCIGTACEDTCCQGWVVTIDEKAYRSYQALPVGPLRSSIEAAMIRPAEGADGVAVQAAIKMDASGHCPLLSGERLCRIQAELGEKYLCRTCSIYPRTPHRIDKLDEQPLSVSCPEAARLVLLSDSLLSSPDAPGYTITWDDQAKGPVPLRTYFWPIRAFTLGLMVDRTYPLWQRLFLLGAFARRMDAFGRGELRRTFPEFLDDFSQAVRDGSLRPSMETVRADLPTQLDMVIRIVNLGANCAFISLRLMECLQAFSQGIGYEPGRAIEHLAAPYDACYRNSYAPFFERHPNMLENYLVNQMFRWLFPFGATLFDPAAAPEAAKAFAALATRFAIVKGLLIGVAGFYGDKFSAAHVVETVQVVTRHFEHNRQLLAEAAKLLARREMDSPSGLTTLLRN